jgi:hypothetical protein
MRQLGQLEMRQPQTVDHQALAAPAARCARRRPRHAHRRPQAVRHWQYYILQFRKKFGKANVTSLVERVSRLRCSWQQRPATETGYGRVIWDGSSGGKGCHGAIHKPQFQTSRPTPFAAGNGRSSPPLEVEHSRQARAIASTMPPWRVSSPPSIRVFLPRSKRLLRTQRLGNGSFRHLLHMAAAEHCAGAPQNRLGHDAGAFLPR